MKPPELMTTVSCEKGIRICDTLDQHPEAWKVYGETIRQYLEATRTTLVHYSGVLQRLRGAGIYRDSRPISVRARRMRLRRRLWSEREHKCERCGVDLQLETFQPHHLKLIEDGGTDEDKNVQMLCLNCHKMAHARSNGKAGASVQHG